jgi:hypothetical protein
LLVRALSGPASRPRARAAAAEKCCLRLKRVTRSLELTE